MKSGAFRLPQDKVEEIARLFFPLGMSCTLVWTYHWVEIQNLQGEDGEEIFKATRSISELVIKVLGLSLPALKIMASKKSKCHEHLFSLIRNKIINC